MKQRIIAGFAFLENPLSLFKYILRSLLNQNVIVPLPSQIDIVVVVDGSNFAVTWVAMTSHCLTALLDAFASEPAGFGFDDWRNSMQLFNQRVLFIHEFFKIVVA